MIHAEQQTIELEEEDRVKTAVVGLRYTGARSTQSPNRPRDSGGWPGRSSFQGGAVKEVADDGETVREREPGPIQIGIVPDTVDGETVTGGTLAGLENLPDFEVIYDPGKLAEAILKENYLPPAAFGGERQSPDYDVRQRVFDHLGIPDRLGTPPEAEDEIREALAEVAEAELDEESEAPPDAGRERELRDEYTRSDLYNAAQKLGIEVEWAEASKTGLAEKIVKRSPGDVRRAIDGEEVGPEDGDEETDDEQDEE